MGEDGEKHVSSQLSLGVPHWPGPTGGAALAVPLLGIGLRVSLPVRRLSDLKSDGASESPSGPGAGAGAGPGILPGSRGPAAASESPSP